MGYAVEIRVRRRNAVLLHYPCSNFAEARDLADRENKRWGYDYQVTLIMPQQRSTQCSCSNKLYCTRNPATMCRLED